MERGSLTTAVALPERLLVWSIAVIIEVPAATAVAKPFKPVVLLMITTAVSDELQFTADVQFNVVPSVNVAVAINCCAEPVAMVALAGLTLIELILPPFRQLIKPSEAIKNTAKTNIYDLIVFIRIVSLISRTGQWGVFWRIVQSG
jgi:hypothetical protein